jgi:16S rRNA (guanine527-N7)-methyltransferase
MHPAASDVLSELIEHAHKIGVPLDRAACDRLRRYVDTLLFWNERLSLTGARSERTVFLDHVLDSLHVCRHVPNGAQLADLGSGAGFPGVPIAVARPDVHVVLVESRRKRANFLREVVRKADLANAEVSETRAEDLGEAMRARFDVVTSRALSSLDRFLDLAAPILKPGGLAIAMKGPATANYRTLHDGYGYVASEPYRLPSGAQLSLVMFSKQ